ncbi:TPA: Tc toxin subunit A [Yersinia enterocolitica]
MPTKNSNTTAVEVNKYLTEKRAQQFRNDPALLGITKLNIIAEAKALKRSAKLSGSNEIPERSNQYVESTSIQSMFSPGRYLCELYNVAKELHKEDDPLHIDQRRPDLQDLSLQQVNMEQEVSTLDILLKVLGTESLLPKLATYKSESGDGSFTLPYDDNLTIINAVLESKSTSLRNIATLLTDDINIPVVKLTPALVQEQLGLNPASYEWVKIELAAGDSSPRLAHATKLSVKRLEELVTGIKTEEVNEE